MTINWQELAEQNNFTSPVVMMQYLNNVGIRPAAHNLGISRQAVYVKRLEYIRKGLLVPRSPGGPNRIKQESPGRSQGS